MKKFSMLVIAVVVGIWLSGATESNAAPKLLPKGAKVSAVVHSDGTADITVAGVDALDRIEYYSYGEAKNLKGPAIKIDLREGRRFQVVNGGYYALLTPDMNAKPRPEFFGPGVGLDCSNTGGCTFIVSGGIEQ